MVAINIPDGKGGWKKLPVLTGEGGELTKGRLEDTLGHTINSDVPANAVFTDTRYRAGKGIAFGEGNEISVSLGELATIKTSKTEPVLPSGGQWHKEEDLK